MVLPLTQAEALYREVLVRLDDDLVEVDEITLRRWIRDAKSLLDESDDAGTWQVWTVIGRCELHLAFRSVGGRKHAEAALDAYLQAYELRPTNPETANDVGRVYGMLGRPELALPYLLQGEGSYVAGTQAHVTTLVNLAVAHHSLDDPQRANDYLRRALREVQPTDEQSLLRIAHAQAELGHEDDAAEVFVRYLAAADGVDRGDDLAVDVIRRTPAERILGAIRYPNLRIALVNVLRRDEEPVPEAMATPALRELSPEGWDRLMKLAEA